MHCWKTINVRKQYGFDRIFMLSSLIVLAVFSIFYVAMEVTRQADLSDQGFGIFFASFLLLYPTHKLIHYLPLIRYRKEVRFYVKRQLGIIPILVIRIKEPIPKTRFLFALLAPFVLINGVLIAGAILFPMFNHYFTMLLAYHCGICLIDLLYIKNLARSPKLALIEETDNGYEILVPPVSV
ncbi:DUF3267 domain-containing protein [Paenisporosarcina cavernae]|uniref:DUF3267 domain-containing protein n=1 Tax=Paenisporosarcina cavernae TaxID=2320858 RepID=A0A385YXK9_9BACL|nr:DUF3267 domain-containing protein [Paenisporosarcina cavernae]AYC30172.1 DUF3267 domain-containing protein [Paenisporosarcina cavernae]